MENFFKDQMAAIHEALEAKERAFEKLLQEERERLKLSNSNSGSTEERKLRYWVKKCSFIGLGHPLCCYSSLLMKIVEWFDPYLCTFRKF